MGIGVCVDRPVPGLDESLARGPYPSRVFRDARLATYRAYRAAGTGWIALVDRRQRVRWVGYWNPEDMKGVAAALLRERGTN